MDRNVNLRVLDGSKSSSLSVRRAWIEMIFEEQTEQDSTTSLSVRRAWIEIKVYGYGDNKKIVALRKESVDRNITVIRTPIGCVCRSP